MNDYVNWSCGLHVDSEDCRGPVSASFLRTRVQRTVLRRFAALRQLWQINQLVLPAMFQTLVVGLVLLRLDYGNGVLVGLPVYLVRRL